MGVSTWIKEHRRLSTFIIGSAAVGIVILFAISDSALYHADVDYDDQRPKELPGERSQHEQEQMMRQNGSTFDVSSWREALRKPSCSCDNDIPRCLFQRPYKVDKHGYPLNDKGEKGFDGQGSVNMKDWEGTVMKAEDVTPSDFFCKYYCNCRPLLLKNMYEEWPELRSLDWETLETASDLIGHTQAYGKNLFADPSEEERSISVGEFLSFRSSKSVFPRYTHYYGLAESSTVIHNIFQKAPGVLNGDATLSLTTANGSIQVHNDAPFFGGFFAVVKGRRRYVLIHSLELNRVCYNTRGAVIVPEQVLPATDMPSAGYDGDKEQIEKRQWPQVCNNGCCFNMYVSEEERQKSLPNVTKTARLEIDVEAGDFLYLPGGYLHGIYSYTDTIGLVAGYNGVFDEWSAAKRGFHLRDFDADTHRDPTPTRYNDSPQKGDKPGANAKVVPDPGQQQKSNSSSVNKSAVPIAAGDIAGGGANSTERGSKARTRV